MKNNMSRILTIAHKNLIYWIPFPIKYGKLMPVLCDEVTQCLDLLTLAQQAQMTSHHTRQNN